MYSSEDLERFYFQYQTEGLPHGESIQHFCVKNKVPYVKDSMPDKSLFSYDISEEQAQLESLRRASMDYLRNAITNE